MRLWLAIRVFFRVLSDKHLAGRVTPLLSATAPAAPDASASKERAAEPTPARGPARATVGRSEAITLLAALQREARFVDIVKEPLDQYSDAQVGAAARDVLRDCGRVLERLFAIRPLVEQEEGTEIEAPAGYDAARYRLTGNVHGSPPFRGRVVHHGWHATRSDLPVWSGGSASVTVVAPVEIDVR